MIDEMHNTDWHIFLENLTDLFYVFTRSKIAYVYSTYVEYNQTTIFERYLKHSFLRMKHICTIIDAAMTTASFD